jgi:hypothetical protein
MEQFLAFTQHPAVEKWFRELASITYAMRKLFSSKPLADEPLAD